MTIKWSEPQSWLLRYAEYSENVNAQSDAKASTQWLYTHAIKRKVSSLRSVVCHYIILTHTSLRPKCMSWAYFKRYIS